ncbi:MAG TPA: pyridoxal phosphate-dependent aminotransferase, partial [Kofleriaceae bacterium]|nr:pyridoxal phosphate-dependent aminotransferase [Kofleriaceae bacterium]
ELVEVGLGYGTAEGDRRLRELVAGMHGVAVDDVVLTVGGMQTLFLVAFTLCARGDEVVTTSPLFPLARNALESVGAAVRVLELSFDRGYRVDVDELARCLSPRTKLVCLATPQNPSGVAIPADAIRRIAALMGETCPEAYLLLDATYRDAAYGDDPVADSYIGLSSRIISTASLSKCHGAPGLRLGWAITRDPSLRDDLVVGKFNTVISCSPVDEFLSRKVLEQRDAILGERRRRLAGAVAAVERWVGENGRLIEWVRPDAGALCCVRLRPALFDDAAVARFYQALSGEGVRVATGTWFGEAARVFRLGFGLLEPADLAAALAGVSSALRAAAREAA